MISVELDLLDEIEDLRCQLVYLNNNLSFIRNSAFPNKKAYEKLEGNYSTLKKLEQRISSVKTRIEKSSTLDLRYQKGLKDSINNLEGLYNNLLDQYAIQWLIYKTSEQEGQGNKMVIEIKDPERASSITAYTS